MSVIKEELAEIYPDMLFMDGFDEALIGKITTFGRVAPCYSRPKVIEILVKDGCSDVDEAEEYFEFNILGAYVGEYTPCFLDLNCLG